jgi:hypothetical protein
MAASNALIEQSTPRSRCGTTTDSTSAAVRASRKPGNRSCSATVLIDTGTKPACRHERMIRHCGESSPREAERVASSRAGMET